MTARRLLDWERDAIVMAYVAKEKIEAISAEFGVSVRYPSILAKRRGHQTRPTGRPKMEHRRKPVLAVQT